MCAHREKTAVYTPRRETSGGRGPADFDVRLPASKIERDSQCRLFKPLSVIALSLKRERGLG